MADADWRTKQRAWEANPGDQQALRSYIAARRAAGLHVGGDLLDQRVFPAGTLTLDVPASLSLTTPDDQHESRSLAGGDSVALPEHRHLYVSLERVDDASLARACAGLAGVTCRVILLESPDVTDRGSAPWRG